MSRRSSNNVSLFPFLAVLVCAMGALILLLLVTTRRIRSDQLAAIEAQEDMEEAPAPDVEPQPLMPVPESPAPAISPHVEPETTTPLPPVASATVETPVPNLVAEVDCVEDHRERDLEVLRGYDARLNEHLSRWAEHDRRLQAHYAELTKRRDQLTEQQARLKQQVNASSDEAEALAEAAQRLNVELASVRRDLAAKESEPVNAKSKFRIVPFDGLSGTVRRPIMIECVNDRFRFVPEGVQLTKAELEIFVASFNPLLSGASALRDYWSAKDRREHAETATEPYILLIVRPSGAISFYGAKRMLAKLGVPVGYELLAEDQELDLPLADEQATIVCREAVNRTLARAGEINKLRPYAQHLLAAAREGGFSPPQTPQGRKRYDMPSADKRVESFQRALAGIRTRNAPRPPSLEKYPDFRSQQGDPSEMITQSYGANRPRTRGSQSQQQQGGSGARSYDTGSRNRNSGSQQRAAATVGTVRADDVFGRKQNSDVGRATVAQRQALKQSGRFQDGQPVQNNELVEAPALPRSARGADSTGQANGRRPASITDGSTKPVEPTATASSNGSALPGELKDVGQAGLAHLENKPPATTFYRRAVDLFVDPDSVIVSTNQRISVNQDSVSGPWLGAILTQIEAEVRSWGESPEGTTWAPEVRFRVSPGANRNHTRLRNALKRLGMRTTDEFTIAPRVRNATQVFRQPQQSAIRRTGGRR